jgi:type IV pilus assembly protein PilA
LASFCTGCGNRMNPDDSFCRVCGRQTSAAPVLTTSSVPATASETSGKAIVSLICGLLIFLPPLFIAAIVFGHLALSEIHKSAGRLKGKGIALTGLLLGYLWIVLPVYLIIGAIAIPNMLRARMAANESSAVGSMRTLEVAESTYATGHPGQGYTCSLSDLAAAESINGSLATGQKNGYAFEITDCSAGLEGGPNVKYQIVAYPLRFNQTGQRSFCSDESGIIKADRGGSARRCIEHGSRLQ